jgi:hypothetical protein
MIYPMLCKLLELPSTAIVEESLPMINIINYLDEQMETLADHLLPSLLIRLLKLLWETIMNVSTIYYHRKLMYKAGHIKHIVASQQY